MMNISQPSQSRVVGRRHFLAVLLIHAAYLCMVFCVLPENGHGQFASTPQLGLSAFTDYQHSDIDSVNLYNGNVNVHIPLLSYPQLGDKLRLNFIIRFNAPKWAVTATNVFTNWQTGVPVYFGLWSIGANFPSPIGVDVVRDQGITVGNIPLQYMCVASDGTGPADCNSGQPTWTSSTSPLVGYTSVNMTNLRDRTGAEHTISMNGGDATRACSHYELGFC